MREFRSSFVLTGLAFAVAIGFAAGAAAQPASSGAAAGELVLAVPDPAPEWGGSSQTIHKVSMTDFRTNDATFSLQTSNTGNIHFFQSAPTSQADWWAQAKLPSGAIIDSVQLDACDTSATGQIQWGLARGAAGGTGGSNVTPVGATGTAATPGCAFFSVTPSTPPLVVDNQNFNYWVFVDWSGDFTAAVKVASVRIRYRLQVSPAPGVATFPNDVPTSHPFFRFVEALASAGITGGCGTGSYCPDQAVTRGQMAVFLATALGLHFPN